MKKALLLLCLITGCATEVMTQVSGNTVYTQDGGNQSYGGRRGKTSDTVPGVLYSLEPKDSVRATFVEAYVLMNVKADEHVAVFGLAQDAPTLTEAARKMDTQARDFIAGLAAQGITSDDVFTDFITQNRVYDFNIAAGSSVARERLAGFEVKKNISVHYKDKSLLEKILAAAAKSSVFDLIRVDYIVSDVSSVRRKLLEEAAKVVRKKQEDYARLFSAKAHQSAVHQERYNAFYPSEMYSSYAAYETGGADANRVVEKRKSKTFYFDPLDASGFDYVINPVITEPVVQFTLYLKMKNESGAAQ